MSLIDGLIDELNKSADEWNESNMFELARMCRNAAYTILETRNDAELLRRMWKQARLEAQGLKSENAKLRELVSNCHGWLAVNCEKGYVIPRNGLDAIEQSMRELGVDE